MNILSKRSDGYHELYTLFERISLGDTLILKKRNRDIRFKTAGYPVPKGFDNIVVKAAKLLKEEYGVRAGVDIWLKKHIPISAGLGGGSSNAASVLLGLNRLWSLKLSQRQLLPMAAKLGSDVPFFILEKPYALGSGRGEILEPLKQEPGLLWHCLIKPPFGILTKEAYRALGGLSLTPKKVNVKMLVRSLQKGDSESLSKRLTNSLELTLNNRVKTIFDIKKSLILEGAFASLMSGSGSTVFGLFHSKNEARRAARRLRKKNKRWQVFVASTY